MMLYIAEHFHYLQFISFHYGTNNTVHQAQIRFVARIDGTLHHFGIVLN